MPVMTTNVALRDRSEEVMTACATGFVQLTGTWLPATVTVGWPLASLHSANPPGLLGVKPEPVMVTVSRPFRHVPGSTVIWAALPVAVDGRDAQGMVVVGAVVTEALVVDELEAEGVPVPHAATVAAPTNTSRRASRPCACPYLLVDSDSSSQPWLTVTSIE